MNGRCVLQLACFNRSAGKAYEQEYDPKLSPAFARVPSQSLDVKDVGRAVRADVEKSRGGGVQRAPSPPKEARRCCCRWCIRCGRCLPDCPCARLPPQEWFSHPATRPPRHPGTLSHAATLPPTHLEPRSHPATQPPAHRPSRPATQPLRHPDTQPPSNPATQTPRHPATQPPAWCRSRRRAPVVSLHSSGRRCPRRRR